MSVTLNPVQVQGLTAVAGSLADASSVAAATQASVLGGANVNVTAAALDLDAILAQLRMETNEARLEAARSRLSSALMQISGLSEEHKAKVAELKTAGEELIVAEKVRDADRADFDAKSAVLDEKEAVLNEAKSKLDASKGEQDPAKALVEAAQKDYDSAKAARDAAMKKYESSEAAVSEKRSRFDALIDSLDMASRAALCEALRVDASDIDHLHDEIEEEDKKHSLSVVRSVEDVISDSLKRLDGKIVDEVEDRHLDHV